MAISWLLGGQVGVVGHVKIGAGAQIAGSSNVRGNVPPGVRWGGTPAKPTRLWFRELTVLRRLAERKDVKLDEETTSKDELDGGYARVAMGACWR